ncbi:hypothetical protein CR513_07327, partial [Mucuna pruriens]
MCIGSKLGVYLHLEYESLHVVCFKCDHNGHSKDYRKEHGGGVKTSIDKENQQGIVLIQPKIELASTLIESTN